MLGLVDGRMRKIFMLLTLAVLPLRTIAGGETFTNGLAEKVKAILPAGWEIQDTGYHQSTKMGMFGRVEYYCVALNDSRAFGLRLRRMHIQGECDARVFFLPANYTFPDDRTRTNYAAYFVASNATYQVCVFPPYYESTKGTTWPTMKADIAKAFRDNKRAASQVPEDTTRK